MCFAVFRYGGDSHVRTGSSDLAKNPSTKNSGSICKQNTQFFTSEKLIDLIVVVLSFHTHVNSWMCIKLSS